MSPANSPVFAGKIGTRAPDASAMKYAGVGVKVEMRVRVVVEKRN
jgi:hypothetical protein